MVVTLALHYLDKSPFIIYNIFYVVEFGVLVFCWEFLHVYLVEILVYSFLVIALFGFGIRVILATQNELGSVPSASRFWENF